MLIFLDQPLSATIIASLVGLYIPQIIAQSYYRYQLISNQMQDQKKIALHHLNNAQFQQAIHLYEGFLSQNTNYNKQLVPYKTILHLAFSYLEIQKFDSCKLLCESLIAKLPQYDEAYIYIALSLAFLGQENKAISICNGRTQLNNHSWRIYYAKGYILYKMQKYEEASENFGVAITRNKLNNPKTYMFRAACLSYLTLVDEALRNMGYADLAIEEGEENNYVQLYKYQIQDIKVGLKLFHKYRKKIQEAQSNRQLNKQERSKYESELIKIIGRSIQYCQRKSRQKNRQLEGGKYGRSAYDNLHYQQTRSDYMSNNLSQELTYFDTDLQLKTKRALSSPLIERLTICDWLKQKCSIF